MFALVVMLVLVVSVVSLVVAQDRRNSGINDGWYGHSDHSTDRTGSFHGPWA